MNCGRPKVFEEKTGRKHDEKDGNRGKGECRRVILENWRNGIVEAECGSVQGTVEENEDLEGKRDLRKWNS